MTSNFLRAAFVGWAVTVGVACDDVSPLAYRAPLRDAEPPDHVDEDLAAACLRCANEPGATCRAARDQCQAADPRCGELLDCLSATDCWRQLDIKNFTDPPPCARGCLATAKVSSINEIGAPATGFYLCVFDPARCAPACLEAPATSPSGDR
ncbi:MAG TPA: hypothetical protein VHE30_08020 [Polyangiaceae bacterium]|nr:hypothetical protein [Polyangiaceae bacterium]